MKREDDQIMLGTLVVGSLYLVWLPFVLTSPLGWLFYCCELLFHLLFVLHWTNHRSGRYQHIGGPYNMRSVVDILITTKNEPLSVLRPTVAAAAEILYPNKKVIILDDGARDEVAALAQEFACRYVTRNDRGEKKFKAANLNAGLAASYGSFILVLDADQVPNPRIIDDLLGHFNDPQVAIVTTRQRFLVSDEDFNHDHLFYEHMQTGKNTDSSAISCGSGVLYRRSALEKIGGFSEWNIVEDLDTSYELIARGYKSIYVNQSFTIGDAPVSLPEIYKQRGVWAWDTMRIFWHKRPLFDARLPFVQRLHFFEMGYIYLVSGVLLPLLVTINLYTLVTNHKLFEELWMYLLLRMPTLILMYRVLVARSQGPASIRMWVALFPVFMTASIHALSIKKPVYQVTRKNTKPDSAVTMIWPQLSVFVLSVLAGSWHLYAYGITELFFVNVLWLSLYCYWLAGILPYALGRISVR